MPPFFYTAKSINLQSILYNVSNSTMSSITAQNGKALERNLSSVTALCSWLLVMVKWHLQMHLQFKMSTHNVITVSTEKEEECQKKSEKKKRSHSDLLLEVVNYELRLTLSQLIKEQRSGSSEHETATVNNHWVFMSNKQHWHCCALIVESLHAAYIAQSSIMNQSPTDFKSSIKNIASSEP